MWALIVGSIIIAGYSHKECLEARDEILYSSHKPVCVKLPYHWQINGGK